MCLVRLIFDVTARCRRLRPQLWRDISGASLTSAVANGMAETVKCGWRRAHPFWLWIAVRGWSTFNLTSS
jgi:hypothetical protein